MKRVVVLGSTGSIGTQTLDVIAQHPDRLKVVGLAARRNAEFLQEQASEHAVHRLALYEGPQDGPVPTGMDALIDLVTAENVDIVVVAVAGVIGLIPTMKAIEAGKQIALASKEVLVAAGEVVMPAARQSGVAITPIDSEHSALFQCLQGYRSDQVRNLILTASGGPFRGWKREDLKTIGVEQALNHPTWRMGGKITIDSATLMNKALEMIEARWLFDIPVENIEVIVHPQSVVHSMVRFNDGSVLGQLGFPDMRLPISYALLYPDRLANALPVWSPLDTPNLTFEPVDERTFTGLALARQVVKAGGLLPAVFNAANEEAANAFLRSEIGFLQIVQVVEETVAKYEAKDVTLQSVLDADAQARVFARTVMKGLPV
ncbi:MAG TPA: 1-deoxy-D-xylulose-5-phosphate reductoisomerase [Fimbriimonas sp.]|nr:1-deoxy-D-xylulose-5-phosphate reductoisomerase [Fimbriimonas sp.]